MIPAVRAVTDPGPATQPADETPVEALGDLYRDGITALPGAFDVAGSTRVR